MSSNLPLLFLAFIIFVTSISASPLYDCVDDPAKLSICDWSSAELHAILQTKAAAHPSSSSALTAFIDRLLEEDVDGNVWLSLEKEEIEMLIDKESTSRATVKAAISLRQEVFNEHQSQLPSSTTSSNKSSNTSTATGPNHCQSLIAGLPALDQSIIELLKSEVSVLRSSSSSSSKGSSIEFRGRFPSSAVKRTLPPLLKEHNPHFIVLYGDHDIDISGILFTYVPDALIIAVSAARGDSLEIVKSKLKKRTQKDNHKRRKSGIIIVNIPLSSGLCILNTAGLIPDMIWLSPWIFPLGQPELTADCQCRWWEQASSIIAGYAPSYHHLHQLALTTNHRLYSDQPLFLLSKPDLIVHCNDTHGHTPVKNQPLLGLYMIVKNEAGGMHETMHSVLPYLDYISVLDTGSEDGTPEIINELMSHYGVAGQINYAPFVDFSTTRNLALSYASRYNTTFILMMNGDDTLIGGADLRTFLTYRQHLCGPSDEMYLMSVDYEGHKLSWSERIMRTSNHQSPDWPVKNQHWHYEGLTHESYTHIPYASGALGDFSMTYSGRAIPNGYDDGYRFHLYHTYVRDTPDRLKARAAKDVVLLKRQLEEIPDDPRTMYYISHSYDVQEDYESAWIWHLKRTQKILGQYESNPTLPPPQADREECTCLLRLGKIAAYRLPDQHGWDEAYQWLTLATKLCTDQIESRFYLADHQWAVEQKEEAWKWIEEAEHLRKSGTGMTHVLEADTVNERVPKLYHYVHKWKQEQQKSATNHKDNKKKKTKKKKDNKEEL